MRKFFKKLGDSPINYFSDLFIIAVVLLWIIVDIVMIVMSVYSTTKYQDNTIWSYVTEITVAPITAGIGIWMVKNSVQHALMSKKGDKCEPDFPKVLDEELLKEKVAEIKDEAE